MQEKFNGKYIITKFVKNTTISLFHKDTADEKE